MEMKAFIEGEKINLRSLTIEDVKEGYVNWFNDDEVCRFNSHHVFPYTEARARQYVESIQTGNQNLVLAIIDKVSGTHVGNVSLQIIDWASRNAEFAIVIGEREFWGKGIGKEATTLLIAHAFNTMNLHRIYCYTAVNNPAMQKLAESAGFVKEGVLKEAQFKDGVYYDVIAYGLLNNK
ncbi:N-acetyltransferase [Candidatus Kaiserbacteria bacterium]|nr:N-acetyltransferase [Candidatus Kaiserbacteria bacterium]